MAGNLVEIQFEEAKLKRIERMLKGVPGAMPKVMSRGINRTATMSRTEIIRQIQAKIKIKQKGIKKGLTLEKATRNKWAASIGISTKRIPLIYFNARKAKKGVTYQIDSSGARKQIKADELFSGGFIATMKKTGHEGVFVRRKIRMTTKIEQLFKGKGVSERSNRGVIVERFGPSLGHYFEAASGIAADIQSKTGELLEKNIDDQIKLLLEKRGAVR